MKSDILVEVWRDIKDYEGLYQVSNFGRVRSLNHIGKSKHNGSRLFLGKIIKQFNKGNIEYKRVVLTKNGEHKKFLVHRLVAMAFPDLVGWTEEAKGKPFEELEINHINECKYDNRADNLEWCTSKYNQNYGSAIKKRVEKQKKTMPTMKPILQYTKDGQFVAEYPSIAEASRQTGIFKTNISGCCKNKYGCKSAGGFIWKYKT